jgi:aldehyde:ferredoxin oxidoreductase
VIDCRLDMAFGYVGKILRVNLSNDKIQVENPEENFYRRYFGGRGFVSYFLLRETKPRLDPLSPDNRLIFATGVLTGAPFSGSGRNSVGAKSPLTGAYGDAEVGGFWGAELKHAGFDAIVVEGKAKTPAYLWVHDGQAEIKDARHLWGKEIGESEEIIRQELGDHTVRTAQIGPSGERLVGFACVINDLGHAAGRTGMGAVMGSKNLKAIATKGRERVKVANPEKLRELVAWLSQNLSKREVVGMASSLHVYGTGAGLDAGAKSGNLPYHNFRDGGFPSPDAISAETVKEKVSVGMGTCFACGVRCKKLVKIEGEMAVEPEYGGPEYETLAAFGSDCGVDDLVSICKANEICQRYGLDTISTGATIAFAMECYENGILTPKDTNGIELRFGNADAMLKTTQLIALREGIGNLLAEGVKRVGEKLGPEAERFAVHVKGLEVPMHEPRLKKALGLGYAVSPTGADHCHNMHDTGLDNRAWNEMKRLGVLEPLAPEDFGPAKIRVFKYYTTWRHVCNCLVTCMFVPWNIEQQVELVQAVTGWNTTAYELSKVGERALNMARAFNFREGFTAKDDWLPDRFFHPHNVGALSNTIVNADQLLQAKRTYYRMMNWNEETGAAERSKLEELDVGWVAAEAGIQ